jgi:hypothetical protein
VIGAVAAQLLLGGLPARAAPLDPDCSYPAGYPGDGASKVAVAGWMANGAKARAIPPELPVMGALVESNLQNLPPDADNRAGYFRMQRSIWDHPPYAGFPSNPDLQLRWFIDAALAVRTQRADAGDTEYGKSEESWGQWAADVLLPPQQLRGQYQPRLEEARGLIEQTCSLGGTLPAGGGAGPALGFSVRSSQPVLSQRGVLVRVGCAASACLVRAVVRFSIPGPAGAFEARVFRAGSRFASLAPGESVRLRIRFRRALLRRVGSALRRDVPVAARLTVAAVDGTGNGVSRSRQVHFH